MSTLTFTLLLLLAFPIFSLVYVYQFRGTQRFASPVEYFRKGWPIFAPLNVLLYGLSKKRARNAIIDLEKYPELKALEDNWEIIREEALELHRNGYFDQTTNADNQSYYDVGFRTFYKYGWSKFYLKWYGTIHNSAARLCPKTTEIVSGIPSINGAMYTVLPPGSKLTRHLDPIACSLRYHLGLSTPNHQDCFISIDGNIKSWRDGEAFMFDETYLHHARNDSDQLRIILMCDIERPMFFAGRIFNFFYKKICSQLLVPNLAEDKAGLYSRIFSKVSPILASGKTLKTTNKPLYLLVKWSLNLLLLALLLLVTGTVASFVIGLFKAVM